VEQAVEQFVFVPGTNPKLGFIGQLNHSPVSFQVPADVFQADQMRTMDPEKAQGNQQVIEFEQGPAY
jgi:hypothetical protein